MIPFQEIIVFIAKTIMGLIVLKALIGFHFPWEECHCCGKKYRDHKTKGEMING